ALARAGGHDSRSDPPLRRPGTKRAFRQLGARRWHRHRSEHDLNRLAHRYPVADRLELLQQEGRNAHRRNGNTLRRVSAPLLLRKQEGSAMKFSNRKRRQAPTIIIISLIDILIVLLIFLMVTTTFKQQPALKLVLPESRQAKQGTADS